MQKPGRGKGDWGTGAEETCNVYSRLCQRFWHCLFPDLSLNGQGEDAWPQGAALGCDTVMT